MGQLFYHINTSLDGYINDAQGGIDWSAPSAELHRDVNDMERPIRTYLWGRRLYEVMRVWEDIPDDETQTPEMRDFARIYRAADKVVFSRTLDKVTTPRTRLEHSPTAELLRALKESTDGDLEVGGATLAASALRWGLVDEVRFHIAPVILGGGTRALPDNLRTPLQLLDHHHYPTGTTYLRYRVLPGA